MNDAPIKQPETTATEVQPAELSEPHFDEIAVLIAQPVEPIAKRERDWFAWVEKPRMMIAILAVAAVLGTTALALTLQLPRQRHVNSAATGIKTDESPAPSESPLGAITEEVKPTAPPQQSKSTAARTKNRKARSGDTKPVARRVGVIVYRRSDRP